MNLNFLVQKIQMKLTSYGFFEKAKDGTLLIDEVTEIPLRNTGKNLRVLNRSKISKELMDLKKLM